MTDPDANPDLLLARILDRARRIDASSDAGSDASSDELIVIRARALSRDVLALDGLLAGGHPWPTRWARRYEDLPLPGEEAG